MFIQFRTLQRFTQATPQAAVVPVQLSLSDWVDVLQMPLTVDDQQAVIDAVEYRLQTLLTCEQLIDIGCLMFAQGFGHQTEAPGQLVDLQRVGDR
ncbi:hypothetical protein D3C78_923240 [compost metagenome]